MPRRALTTALLVLALLGGGALVTIAISWGIAALGDAVQLSWRWRQVSFTSDGIVHSGDFVGVAAGGRQGKPVAPPWHIALDVAKSAASGVRAAPGYWVSVEQELGGPRSINTSAFGWPRPALRTVVRNNPAAAPPGGFVTSASVVIVSRGFARTSGSLPLIPYWPGFLLNTLLFAAILAAPLTIIPIRRGLRARRGRCPRCGYELLGLPRCPECGRHARPASPPA